MLYIYYVIKMRDMKTWLCKEGREKFTIEALNLNDAETQCEMWNAVVLGEYNPITNSIKI